MVGNRLHTAHRALDAVEDLVRGGRLGRGFCSHAAWLRAIADMPEASVDAEEMFIINLR